MMVLVIGICYKIGRGELPILLVVAEARRAAAVRATVLLSSASVMMNAQLLGAGLMVLRVYKDLMLMLLLLLNGGLLCWVG